MFNISPDYSALYALKLDYRFSSWRDEDDSLLGYCAMLSRRNWSMFQTFFLPPSVLIALMMEVVRTSEMSVNLYGAAWCSIPVDSYLPIGSNFLPSIVPTWRTCQLESSINDTESSILTYYVIINLGKIYNFRWVTFCTIWPSCEVVASVKLLLLVFWLVTLCRLVGRY
jgi:hypothetical protein